MSTISDVTLSTRFDDPICHMSLWISSHPLVFEIYHERSHSGLTAQIRVIHAKRTTSSSLSGTQDLRCKSKPHRTRTQARHNCLKLQQTVHCKKSVMSQVCWRSRFIDVVIDIVYIKYILGNSDDMVSATTSSIRILEARGGC
jgi:hypothetical protein